jgi:hypothetical protein
LAIILEGRNDRQDDQDERKCAFEAHNNEECFVDTIGRPGAGKRIEFQMGQKLPPNNARKAKCIPPQSRNTAEIATTAEFISPFS